MRLVAYALTAFTGAFLLFSVEPLSAKAILPEFGGSPATWTTCLLFFQVLLFAGYAHAFALSRWVPPRAQLAVLLAWLVLSLLAAPIFAAPRAPPDPHGVPSLQVLWRLAREIGPAYFLLSTTAPLLQHWFSRAGSGRASPYLLYAFSNAGSLGGLLAYPFAIAPYLDLRRQAWSWSLGLLLCGAGLLWCGTSVWNAAPVAVSRTRDAARRPAVGRWLVLSALPSGLLLAITNHITVDVAAVPFLWVVPLSLYLLSFVLCFGGERFHQRGWYTPLWVVSTLGVAASLFQHGSAELEVQLAVFLAALFSICMLCYGELVRLRPDAGGLTVYYLALAGGGVLGGLFVALVAPLVFSDYFELQLGLCAGYAVLLAHGRRAATPSAAERGRRAWLWLGVGLVVPALCVTLWLHLRDHTADGEILARRRGFYGVLRVTRLEAVTLLTHGRIRHGMQWNDPARRKEPTMYFGPHSGIGRVLRGYAPARARHIGVVGLGAGTLASYGRPGDRFRFYELSPDVVDLARRYFSFLSDSAAETQIVLGDGRISLGREPPQAFDVLVLDAFSSDSVPTHLLTVEAFAEYLRHLAAGGILALNVSNRHLDVERVVAGSAAAHGLAMRLYETGSDAQQGYARVRWAIATRDPSMLSDLFGAQSASPAGEPVRWTDQYTNIFGILR